MSLALYQHLLPTTVIGKSN
uniref:Uncharacterized protein n=1 Tax=Arundo donax TaxID=35708 RepID=A0A0A9BX39_ARUDO